MASNLSFSKIIIQTNINLSILVFLIWTYDRTCMKGSLVDMMTGQVNLSYVHVYCWIVYILIFFNLCCKEIYHECYNEIICIGSSNHKTCLMSLWQSIIVRVNMGEYWQMLWNDGEFFGLGMPTEHKFIQNQRSSGCN